MSTARSIARTHALRRWLAPAFLATWAAGLSVVMASLLVGHWVTLPRPAADDARLKAGLASLSWGSESPRWRLHHVLYAGCDCSRDVLERLLDSERPSAVDELVLLVGQDALVEQRCAARGLRVERLTPDALRQRFAVESAPLLVITAPDGSTRYCGGYTDRRRGLALQDTDVLARLRRGELVQPLPVYGCGVSSSLKDALDPLGLKY